MKNLLSAKIFTKSNYQNLNNRWLQVTQMKGKRVTCITEIENRIIQIDFSLSEIVEFNYNNQ